MIPIKNKSYKKTHCPKIKVREIEIYTKTIKTTQNEFYDLLIKRGDLQTRSITQVYVDNESPVMKYEDLVVNQVFEASFETVNI